MFVLDQHTSIGNQFLTELRDVSIQNDRLRFRRNLERLGEIMAYEISKELEYTTITIDTPLIKTKGIHLTEQPVIISILRAAAPFFHGVVNYFDRADCGFIGAYRKEAEVGRKLEIEFGYLAAPSVEGKELLLVDPMLATGKSFVKSLENLLEKHGNPFKIHIVSVIAAPEGVQHISENLSVPHKFWTCALDERLDERNYIVPGLGDAGDLAFGPKI